MRGLRWFIGVCFAFALILATVAAVAQENGGASITDGLSPPSDEVAVEPAARDEEIAARIHDVLTATGWFTAIAVGVRDGVVFLDGRTADDEKRDWAAALAEKTQDVAAVVNRIEADQPVSWSFEPAYREVEEIGRALLRAGPLILLAIVVLPIGWALARFFGRLARRALEPRVSSPLLRDVIAWAISAPAFLVGVYVVLQVAGLTGLALSILGGAGVIGIVVGFAFRDIAENFLASLLLSMRRPYRPGDFIDVAGQNGFVRSMNARTTLLLSSEGNHIQIPNATVFKNIIVNYSTAPARRDTLTVGIGYDASVAEAQQIVIDVLQGHAAVLADPEPLALVDNLGASTVNLHIHYWFNGQAFSHVKVRSALLRLVKKALTEANVSMPDDAREVVFPEGVPLVERQGDAPAPRPADPPEVESAAATTEGEGDLTSEREELEVNALAQDMEGDLLNRQSDADDKP